MSAINYNHFFTTYTTWNRLSLFASSLLLGKRFDKIAAAGAVEIIFIASPR
jgi:hypothetical protein